MAAARAGRLRASFHLYNTEADVDAALNALSLTKPVTSSETARIEPVSLRRAVGDRQRPVAVGGRVEQPAQRLERLPRAGVRRPRRGRAVENGVVGGVVEHDLAEVVPAAARALEHPRLAPDGAVNVPVRSPTNVWSIPTVVEPAVVVHVAPSTENRSLDAYPIPVTGIVTVAPRVLLSGIGTAGRCS